MKNITKTAIVVLLVVIIGSVILLKQGQKENIGRNEEATGRETLSLNNDTYALPRLLDLGADKCIPCKMMASILEALKEEYKGQFEVMFIDVWENPEAAEPYNIKLIPTQIFYDANGNELFRHEGFFSKEDILNKWGELGVPLKEPAKTGT